MKIKISATYHPTTEGPGEVAVWLDAKGQSARCLLALAAARQPNPAVPDSENDVVMDTLVELGDRLQELLDNPPLEVQSPPEVYPF